MTFLEAFDVIDGGQGRWQLTYRGTNHHAGQVWRTHHGFDLFDGLERKRGTFPSIDEALRFLLKIADPAFLQPGAA